MTTAIKEMETLIRSWHEGGYTDDEFSDSLEDLVSRHTCSVEIAKTYANGLRRYVIKDKNGETVAEYTSK